MRTVQVTGSHRVGEVEESNVDGIISQCTEQFCHMSEHGFLITQIKLQVMIFLLIINLEERILLWLFVWP
jgi:hypothetical protein